MMGVRRNSRESGFDVSADSWSLVPASRDRRLSRPLVAAGGVLLLAALASALVSDAAASGGERDAGGREGVGARFGDTGGSVPLSVSADRARELRNAVCSVLATGASGDVLVPWLRDQGFDFAGANQFVARSAAVACPDVQAGRTN